LLLSIFGHPHKQKIRKKRKKTIENMLEENKKYINEKNILEHPGTD